MTNSSQIPYDGKQVIRVEMDNNILRVIVLMNDPKNGKRYLANFADIHESTSTYGVQMDVHIYDGVAIFGMLKDGRVWQITAANVNNVFNRYKFLDCDIVFKNPYNENDQWIIKGGITLTKFFDLVNNDPSLRNLRVGIKPGTNELFVTEAM